MADTTIIAKRFKAKSHPWTPKDPSRVPVASSQALKQAMMLEGLPQSDFDNLLWIMAEESMGQVGVKNQSGSSAQGLFQLLSEHGILIIRTAAARLATPSKSLRVE